MPADLSAIARIPVDDTHWEEGDPAAYTFYRHNRPFYVGMASDIACRLHEHRRAGLSLVADRVSLYPCITTQAARRLERNLILLLNPSENDALPNVSINEKRWYHALWTETMAPGSPENRTWGWCQGCGELLVFLYGACLPATFGQSCESCTARPAWDPHGHAWNIVAEHLVRLFGGPYTADERQWRQVVAAAMAPTHEAGPASSDALETDSAPFWDAVVEYDPECCDEPR